MIRKIISGGQTGGDFGGLLAGKKLGIETGGTAPKGYRTDIGPNQTLKDFGLVEHSDWQYKPRTIENVKNSQGTLWFGDVNSPGAKLTLGTCKKLGKPYIINPIEEAFKRWIEWNKIEVLNVAGNRESSKPGIQKYVEDFLVKALGEKTSYNGRIYSEKIMDEHIRLKEEK